MDVGNNYYWELKRRIIDSSLYAGRIYDEILKLVGPNITDLDEILWDGLVEIIPSTDDIIIRI